MSSRELSLGNTLVQPYSTHIADPSPTDPPSIAAPIHHHLFGSKTGLPGTLSLHGLLRYTPGATLSLPHPGHVATYSKGGIEGPVTS